MGEKVSSYYQVVIAVIVSTLIIMLSCLSNQGWAQVDPSQKCGNGYCDPGETEATCPEDCKYKLPFLATDGFRIINAKGQWVNLRGINFNCFSLFPKKIYEAIEENGGDPYQFNSELSEYYCADEDILNIKDMGANVVRIGFRWWEIDNEADIGYSETALQHLDSLIERFGSNGIYVILALISARQNKASREEEENQNLTLANEIWRDEDFKERIFSLWEKIAERYKDNPYVAGYDVIDKPRPKDKVSLSDKTDEEAIAILKDILKDFYDQAITRIRAKDQKHIIILQKSVFLNKTEWAKVRWGRKYDQENVALSYHLDEPVNTYKEGEKTKAALWNDFWQKRYNDVQTEGKVLFLHEFSTDIWSGREKNYDWVRDVIKLCKPHMYIHPLFSSYKSIDSEEAYKALFKPKAETASDIEALFAGILSASGSISHITETDKELFLKENFDRAEFPNHTTFPIIGHQCGNKICEQGENSENCCQDCRHEGFDLHRFGESRGELRLEYDYLSDPTHFFYKIYQEKFARIGLDFIRTGLHWRCVQSDSNSDLIWDGPDLFLNKLTEKVNEYGRDVEILLNVGPTNSWGMKYQECLRWNHVPAAVPKEEYQEHYYNTVLRSIVERYKGSVRYWQICNEADLRSDSPLCETVDTNDPNKPLIIPRGTYWLGTKEEYLDHLKRSHEVIKSVDPNAKVVLYGTCGFFSGDYGDEINEYLFDSNNSKYYDILDVHIYDLPEVQIDDIVNVMNVNEQGLNKPLWMTESGQISIHRHTNPWFQTTFEHPEELKIQAEETIKRYVISFSTGIKRVCTGGVLGLSDWQQEGYEDVWSHMPFSFTWKLKDVKPSFYTTQLFIRRFKDFDTAEKLDYGIYRFSFPDPDKRPIYVLWIDGGERLIDMHSVYDDFNTGPVGITHIITEKDIDEPRIDRPSPVDNILVNKTPIFVEKMEIFYVDDDYPEGDDFDGDNEFRHIQAAINRARGIDVVVVSPGTYYEQINFGGKAIKVMSEDPNDPEIVATTIIDGQENRSVVTFNSGEWKTSQLTGFTIRNGRSEVEGAGIRCLKSSPVISDCIIVNNKVFSGDSGNLPHGGGGIGCVSSSPTIRNCEIIQNESIEHGGGIWCGQSSSPLIINCFINENKATISGGGICCEDKSSPYVANCVITKNTLKNTIYSGSSGGGGICALSSSSPKIINCTILFNEATNGSGGGVFYHDNDVDNEDKSLKINNCIVRENLPDQIVDANHAVIYSNIQGGYVGKGNGEGNIDRDPLFVDSESGDFHLQSENSPCVDRGTSDKAPLMDKDGNPRPIGTGWDMGAYEYLPCPLDSLKPFYHDKDGDNYAGPEVVYHLCTPIEGYMEDAEDCDDTDSNCYPGASEICDGKDNDCDEKLQKNEKDEDEDGYMVCEGDCNDSKAKIHPGADEDLSNGEDDDCGGNIDVADECIKYKRDRDGDSYGIKEDKKCLYEPVGYYTALDGGDCDDSEANIYPGAPEVCDDKDNDCNGVTDDPSLLEYSTYYPDVDGDGFGNSKNSRDACKQPEWYVLDPNDCEDSDPNTYPNALEICDGKDNDCDGTTPANEADADLDGVRICEGDCDDSDPNTYPSAQEICDGKDNNCDDYIDPDYELDNDGDGLSECQGDNDDTDPNTDPNTPNPECEIVPDSVRISNISSASVTISWFTKPGCLGEVQYSDNPDFNNPMTAYDTRGKNHINISHFVRLSGLDPNTTYYFEVQSGDVTDNNEGNYYSFTTCDFSMGDTQKILKGKVYQEDGLTPAEGAIVLVTIIRDNKQSYRLSSLADAEGRWSVDLRNLKNITDCMDFRWSPGDTIKIEAKGEAREGALGYDSEQDAIDSGTLPQDCGILILKSWICMKLNLNAGYNLISLPLDPLVNEEGESIAFNSYSLMTNIPNCDELTNWDPDSQFYYTAYMEEGLPYGPWFDILPGRAYFVSVKTQTEASFCGYLSAAPDTIELRTGYNFISCIYEPNMPDDRKTGYTSYSVLEDIPKSISIHDWDPLAQFYEFAYMDEGMPYNSIFNILIGRGFILLVHEASLWTPQAEVSMMRMREKPSDPVIRYKTLDATEPVISNITVSNISSASATISWFTDTAYTGIIRYSDDPNFIDPTTAEDIRVGHTGTSHYVKLSGLTHKSIYYFEVQSGNTIDDNSGAYHSFDTCGFSMGVTPKILKGKVYLEDRNTPAEGAIVFAIVDGQSIPLSSLVGDDARWDLDLRNLKYAQTCEDFNWVPGNNVEITVKYNMYTEVNNIMIESGPLPQDSGTSIVQYISQFLFYRDADGDTFGDPNNWVQSPDPNAPYGYVDNNQDCDDTDGFVNPAATEICDNKNNDCDNMIDEDLERDCNTACGTGIEICENGQWVNCTAPPCEEEFEINLSASWSMISLPVEPSNAKFSVLFPGATVMYRYERGTGYVRVQPSEQLQVGTGYWILINSDQNYVLTGKPIPSYSKTIYSDGWEMIGGCSYTSQPSADNCSIGVIYGYAKGTGYHRIPEGRNLEPGEGSWILFNDIADHCEFTIY